MYSQSSPVDRLESAPRPATAEAKVGENGKDAIAKRDIATPFMMMSARDGPKQCGVEARSKWTGGGVFQRFGREKEAEPTVEL